ncbi:uncharacterized protein K02A2.6-like [Ixodes scapularis]|uniref:uncharacterized protein K02A2.6-like n=1 Tax=Ixodes scapularis TaxID=6945 RepID=UPI001C386261|nr:uncharacterized protein K02A2.6-like [Ixodes scapularis]
MEGSLKTPRPLDLSSQSPDVWDDWLQSYEWYATAIQLQKKPPEVQVANFMTVIGPDAQNVFRTLPLSEDDKKNLDIVKQRFKEHSHPKVNPTYERYRFNQMKQKEGETFNEFLTAARLQAKKCKFGELTDELLRDRIIVGITNDAVNLCKASEQASQQLKEIANKETRTVDAVTKKTKQLPRKKTVAETKEQAPENSGMARKACSFCGGFHRPKECPAYGKTCNKCQKKGHFAAVCRSSRSMVQHKVHAIDNHEDPEEMYMSELRTKTSKTVWQEEIQFKCGTKVVMKLDTGAQCNVLPSKNAQAMRLQVFPSPVKRIATYSNHRMQVIGDVREACTVRDQPAKLRFLVVNSDVTPVLGQNACELLNLVKRVHTVQATQEDDEIFQGIGCIKNFVYDADVKDEASKKLENKPPRRVPYALMDEVKQKLTSMEQKGIVEKITEPTPFCSEMVVVKQRGKIRICIDPVELNTVLIRRNYPHKTLEEIVAHVRGSKRFTLLDLKKGFWQMQKFVPNLADKTAPLRKLITKDTEFLWTEEQSKALTEIKQALKSAPTLAYYNVNGAMTLSEDQYAPTIVYKKGTELVIADLLSRDCIKNESAGAYTDDIQVMAIVPMSPETMEELKRDISQDKEIQEVIQATKEGWPNTTRGLSDPMKLYWSFRDEPAVYEDMLFRSDRIVIPKTWRNRLLVQIHAGHLGINSCLKRARETVYWPGLTTDIKCYVERCATCQATNQKPAREPLHLKEIPDPPWERVASDLLNFEGKSYVVIVDSYSGYLDIKKLSGESSKEVVNVMKVWLATHGVPKEIETDNGPCYAAQEFKNFSRDWGFQHVTSSPRYAQSNGLAERAVQTAKGILRKCSLDKSDIQMALLSFRNTPRSEELGSPAQRLYSRRTRTLVPTHNKLLKPEIIQSVPDKLRHERNQQKAYADQHSKRAPAMAPGDKVKVWEENRRWVPGTVAPATLIVTVIINDHSHQLTEEVALYCKCHFQEEHKTIKPNDAHYLVQNDVPLDNRNLDAPVSLDCKRPLEHTFVILPDIKITILQI